jgi:hypothetical protein
MDPKVSVKIGCLVGVFTVDIREKLKTRGLAGLCCELDRRTDCPMLEQAVHAVVLKNHVYVVK